MALTLNTASSNTALGTQALAKKHHWPQQHGERLPARSFSNTIGNFNTA